MHRNQSVSAHNFAMVPRADIPRSHFQMEQALKTTFDAGYLVPIYCEEALPGDSMKVDMTAFARLATPINPIMDNLHLDTFFFFVPNRLIWANWEKFNGEQANPGDSTSYVIPVITSPNDGYAVNSLGDYFGLPTVGQIATGLNFQHSALPMRAYNLIWNEWFRDENLQNSRPQNTGDGPDSYIDYGLLKRGKRHDYFTSALPWPQKGPSVTIPLGTTAQIRSDASPITLRGATGAMTAINAGTGGAGTNIQNTLATGNSLVSGLNWGAAGNLVTGMYADLSQATAATINQLRQSFQIQKLLERDARGGTRYTEILLAHFGVRSPDARLQRPEYLGGGSQSIQINPVAQTSGTNATGTTTPLGNLAGVGTMLARHGYNQSFVEHGYVIGLVNVRADLTYQQGLRRHWSRKTRYDYYWPAFAMLGEQTILNKEIYTRGDANDELVFGYQERWAEYRYTPSQITGRFRSTSALPLDNWHLAQKFTALPALNNSFIAENPPLERILAVGASAAGSQLLMDVFFRTRATRPLPMYSVPGLIDHF